MISGVMASLIGPGGLFDIPTPDPATVSTAVENAGLNVNAAVEFAAPFLTVGAGFVLLVAAIRIGVRLLGGVRRVAR